MKEEQGMAPMPEPEMEPEMEPEEPEMVEEEEPVKTGLMARV